MATMNFKIGFAFTLLGATALMAGESIQKLYVEMNRLRTHSEAKEFVIEKVGRDYFQNCSLRKKVRLIKAHKIK